MNQITMTWGNVPGYLHILKIRKLLKEQKVRGERDLNQAIDRSKLNKEGQTPICVLLEQKNHKKYTRLTEGGRWMNPLPTRISTAIRVAP